MPTYTINPFGRTNRLDLASVTTVTGALTTLVELTDTPSVYDNGKVLKSTISGTEWATEAVGISNHSELNELDYASAGHTGFSPTSHSHTESDVSDLDKYTEAEVDTISGSLNTKISGKSDTGHTHDDRYYTESEVDTISGSLNTKIEGKAATVHTHDDRYYTESEVDTISGSLNTKISGKADTVHSHTESDISDLDKYTEAEVDTISGSLNTKIDGKADTVHTHDDRYYTESEVDTISGSLQSNIDGKSDTGHTHDGRYYTESEVDTISGSLNTKIEAKPDTILELTDTPSVYSDGLYLKSTTSGVEWATASGGAGSSNHSELNELDYASAGHTGFASTDALTTTSGVLQDDIDTHGHVANEITVATINTPTYNDIQDWINNTQSSGRMSGGVTSAHTDTVTGVTEGGAGSGELKVSGDQTTYFSYGDSILVDESTNNDGYYTVASGIVYSGGTTTIPVDEAVGAVADGVIYNGRVDVADGTGFIKLTDSNIAETVSFNLHAQTNISLTDITTNYLYVDYNGGTPDIQVTLDRTTIEKNMQFPLSMSYRNGPRTWTCDCGIYLPNRTRLDHDRILILRGYERASGGEISEIGTRSIESTAGDFYRGPVEITTTAKNSTTDKMTVVYYDGADWVWTEEETQIDNTYYNNTTTGLLVELTVNRYAVHWVCIDYLSNLYVVYGRGDYTLAQAELAAVPSLMPVVAFEFGIVAAKVIVQKAASSFIEIISAYKQLFPSATPTSHNNLSGLNENDYKHLTAANHTDLTDGGDTTLHKHDGQYYTEGEVDTISGALNTKISAKPNTLLELTDTPAAYDDNKYLKSTVDGTEWATVSGGGSSIHSELSNLAYADSGHTDFASSNALTSTSGVLQTNIDSKADTVHTHDDRYYTESEVDTISGSLSSEIDSDISTHASNSDAHHNESHTVVSHSDTTATGANLNELVGSGNTSLHKHDDHYYTEAEIDTISGSLNTKVDGKDNYTSWSFAVDSVTKDAITSSDVLDFVGGDNITITRSAEDQITISGTTGGGGLSNIVEDTSPELGGQLVTGEYDIKLDSSLSADEKYSGKTSDGVLGDTLAFGDLVYLNTTDQRWEKTDADAEATSGDVELAIVLAAGSDGDTRLLLKEGYVKDTSWTFTSYGQALFISVTEGTMTQTVPSDVGDIVRVVGKASTAQDQIYFKPSQTWLEVSSTGHEHTLLSLTDTPAAYDDNKYLKSTTSGAEWATVSGGTGVTDHSELSNLSYASASHTGFSPDTHTHDDRYYTEAEVDTISGSLSSEIDSDIATHASNSDTHHTESHTVVSHSDTTATGANLNELVGAGDTSLHKHDAHYYTLPAVDTISGALNTKIEAKPDTLLELEDTPSAYSDGLYLKSTASGVEWATASGGAGGDYLAQDGSTPLTGNWDVGSTYKILIDRIEGSTTGGVGHAYATFNAGNIVIYDDNGGNIVITSGGITLSDDSGGVLDLDDNFTVVDGNGNYLNMDSTDATLASKFGGNLRFDGTDTTLTDVSGNTLKFLSNMCRTTVGNSTFIVEDAGTGDIKISPDGVLAVSITTANGMSATKITSDTSAIIGTTLTTGGNATISGTVSVVDGLGAQLKTNEYDIKLDTLLSADGKYSGITRDGVLGDTLAFGDLVYLNTTDQRWEKASANVETTSGDVELAIILVAGVDGETRLLLTDGYVREDDWDFTSYGKALYVSTTAGDMTQTVVSGTGETVRMVGKAGTTADQIHFRPSEMWVELS